MPEKEKKLESEPSQDFIRNQFLNLGVDLEKENPVIFERILELNGGKESHFRDAVKMAEIIDLIWEDLEVKSISREKMKLCALLHDIGKTGPLDASPKVKKVIKNLFEHRTFKDSRGKNIDSALQEEKVEDWEEVEKILKEELGVDLKKETMIDLWQRHADWTYEILKNNKSESIDEEVVIIASSHHILDGKNPAGLATEDIPEGAKSLEMMDKYQVLTLVDKYQAFRGRSAYDHEEAIMALVALVEGRKWLSAKAKEEYFKFIDILAKSKDKLEKITRENNG